MTKQITRYSPKAADLDHTIYMVGTFDGIDIFLHEAEWVLNNKRWIPDSKLVAHKDHLPINNTIDNLYLVDENKEYGDLHDDRVFHESSNNVNLIYKHFPDIAKALSLKDPRNVS
jgi:hypothetical protein